MIHDRSIDMSAIPFTVLTAASWAVTGVAILLTAGRFWIRCTIIRRLSWDDAAHLLGLLLLIAQVSIVTGAASMVYEISYNNYDLERDGRFEAEHRLFVHLNVAGILISWCCLYAIKISFLMLYHRIFQISDRFIQAWWTVLAIVFLSFWVLVAGCLTECGSPSDIGDYSKFSWSDTSQVPIPKLKTARKMQLSFNGASTDDTCHLYLCRERRFRLG